MAQCKTWNRAATSTRKKTRRHFHCGFMLTISRRKAVCVRRVGDEQYMGCSIFVICDAAVLFTAHVTTCAFMNTHVHLLPYVHSVPENCRVIPVRRSTHIVTLSACWPSCKYGAPDSSWIPQGLATMLQSVSKSSLSTAALFLGYGENANLLGRFAHEIRITGSVISPSFTLHSDRKHGDN